jgi:RNA polymerase sigma-70 factor, ECF subfamily
MTTEEFESAYRRFAPAVLGYARRCVGRADIAEEITAEAFLELYRKREAMNTELLPAWLYTVVKNRSVDYWRRQRLEERVLHSQPEPVEDVPPVDDWGVLEDPSLKDVHRVCLTLRYLHGMSREEIASFTGWRETQVKGYLRYGLELLRKAVARSRK